MIRGPLPRQMQAVMAELRTERGDEVFETQISEATAIAESVEDHLPVFVTKPSSKAARQTTRVAEEFYDRTSGD